MHYRKNRRSLRSLRELFFGTRVAVRETRRSNAAGLESLEGRLMLAGDLRIGTVSAARQHRRSGGDNRRRRDIECDGWATADSMAEGEETTAPDLVAFAKALSAKEGVKLFGCRLVSGLYDPEGAL